MKILLISYFFPPQKSVGGFRAASLCKYLPEHQIKVFLLTSSTTLCKNVDLQKEFRLEKENVYCVPPSKIKDIGYKIRILSLLELIKLDTLLFFPDTYCTWIKKAMKMGEKIITTHNPELILTTGPPFSVFIVGNKLSQKFNIPIILDYRDPWNGNPSMNYNTLWVRRLALRKEKEILKNAAKIVTVGKGYAEKITKSTGIPTEKIEVIYNGYFEEQEPLKKKQKSTKVFKIGYFGNVYKDRKKLLKNLLKGIRKAIENMKLSPENIEFCYAGLTSRKVIKKIVEEAGMKEYFVDLNTLEEGKLIKTMQRINVLVGFSPERMKYMIPTKLYDYAMAQSHILIIGKNDGPKELLNEIDQKYSVSGEKIEEICQVITELFKEWKSNRLEYGCEKEKLKKFSRRNQAKRYAKIIHGTPTTDSAKK